MHSLHHNTTWSRLTSAAFHRASFTVLSPRVLLTVTLRGCVPNRKSCFAGVAHLQTHLLHSVSADALHHPPTPSHRVSLYATPTLCAPYLSLMPARAPLQMITYIPCVIDPSLFFASGLLEFDHVTASLRTNLHGRLGVVPDSIPALEGEGSHVECADRHPMYRQTARPSRVRLSSLSPSRPPRPAFPFGPVLLAQLSPGLTP